MGKVFITDEVNDMYTADVTNAGKLKVEDGAAAFWKVSSAFAEVSGVTGGVGAGTYLKNIIFGQYPATAASLTIYDTLEKSAEVSSFGTSGSNIVATFVFPVGFASGQTCSVTYPVTNNCPYTIPLNVYLASGLTVQQGCSATTDYLGCVNNVTITYQS